MSKVRKSEKVVLNTKSGKYKAFSAKKVSGFSSRVNASLSKAKSASRKKQQASTESASSIVLNA